MTWWKITGISLAVGMITLLALFLLPNVYRATAVIKPAVEEEKNKPYLGVLTSFGISVGEASKVEDLETLFGSKDLTARVFRNHQLWLIVFPNDYDPGTGKLKIGWSRRLFGNGKGAGEPDDWDAIRAVKDRLNVAVNKKAGTLVVSFDSTSPEGSAKILGLYLDEAKSRLQEEAFERASRNKKFIEGQIGRTVDALSRERLYALYGQEVEREMLARNREQFGFKIIDAPRVPDRKHHPRRARGAIAATLLCFAVLGGWHLFPREGGESARPEA